MNIDGFSKWTKWENRNSINNLEFPGVYCISINEEDLSEKEFSFIKSICYVGMSNAIKGLKSRLNQFDNTISNKKGHGGAARFMFYYKKDKEKFIDNLYVSVKILKCDVKNKSPEDLRKMGEVTKLEYDCMAYYVEKFDGKLPKFNDMKKSPKK